MKGLGEKFSPDLHTGTGNFSIPISLPPGRNGFQPELSLGFSTGQGSDVFGLGWNLSVPGVTRKTSDGVPHYNEAGQLSHHRREDVFILSGSEDLVKVDDADPQRVRYRPRTEGLFAEIIHDTSVGNEWRVRTKDGMTSVYRPAISAPGQPSKIFSWCLKETRDTFANLVEYEYESKSVGTGDRKWSEHLLKAIRYVNYEEAGTTKFLLSVEFDHQDRADSFSDYRSGFEIRVTQRCRSIRVTGQVQGGAVRLIKKYNFSYESASHNGASLLTRVGVTGENDDASIAVAAGDVPPPLIFGYTKLGLASRQRRFIDIKVEGQSDIPLSHPDIDFLDLHGNGLPDILDTRQGYHYVRNLGAGRFDLRKSIERAPPYRLSDPGVAVLDADGDGRPDLIATIGNPAGRFPLSHDLAWDLVPPQLFSVTPSFSVDDPEVRLLDMDGDGLPDALRSGASFDIFFGERDGRQAWKSRTSKRRKSLAKFPNISFTDLRVRTGDLSGDGLQDIMVIHEGAVDFWPNCGHGEWAPLQTLPIEPRLPRDFDPKLLLVGDVDGDGLADLVLADEKGVRIWINQSGNRFKEYPLQITGTPAPNSTTALRLIDLNGTGVSGLLWTQTPGGASRPATLFLDFTTGTKPNLLNHIDNQMGAVTTVEYKSSAEFFLSDFQNPRTRWRTPLPFPVQVVSLVAVEDAVSQGRLTTQYRYHHGYWDGVEREFRGFGMVETLDTEEVFDSVHMVKRHYSPPINTKTWFHQGPVGPEFGDWREIDYTHEYWAGDPQLLDHTGGVNAFLRSLNSRRARRDALRTLRGSILRTELYAHDNTPLSERPYTVTEHAYSLCEESAPPAGTGRSHIFFPHAVAQRTTQWERGDDPRSQFAFTAGYDEHGQPRQQTTVAPPRRTNNRHATTGVVYGAIDLNEMQTLAQYVRTDFAKPAGAERLFNRPAQVRSYECKAPPPGADTAADDSAAALRKQFHQALGLHLRFSPAPLAGQIALPEPDATFSTLIGHQIHHYDGQAFSGLNAGVVGQHGALVRTEALVFTDAILQTAYGVRRPKYLGGPADIPQHPDLQAFGADLGYRPDITVPGNFWVDTLRNEYDFQRAPAASRGLILATKDPRGHVTRIEYDPHDLLPAKVTDPTGLTTTATYNYRVLQPSSVTDANGTTTHILYTALGLPRLQFVESADQSQGGTPAKPELRYRYGFDNFMVRRGPIHVETERRIHHAKALQATDDTLKSREFSDGFGRLVQSRAQSEDLVFGERGDDVGLSGQVRAAVAPAIATRFNDAVVVSGFQDYDQKGRVIRKYEPCFDTGFDYQPGRKPANAVFVSMFYDPRGQVIRTVNPDGSEQRVIFGVPGSIAAPQLDAPATFEPTPWESYVYDANDLAPLTHAGFSSVPANHHFTPVSTVLDGMGRAIAQVVRNGPAPASDWHITRNAFDVWGNLLTISDALNRVAFVHSHDLLNRPLKVDSIDAGLHTSVLDALGNLVEYRDSKGSLVLRRYDELNRLVELWAKNNNDPTSLFTCREKLAYAPGGAPQHATGRLIEHRDEAGIVKIHNHDFKGNILETSRQVPQDSEMAGWLADWSAAQSTATEAKLEPKAYVTTSGYDALNRVTTITYPEDVTGNRVLLTPQYNRGGALKAVKLTKNAGASEETFVEHIAYSAKAQRVLIAYGNGVMTRHAYDPNTFRLVRLRTEQFQKAGALQWNGLGAATGLNDEIKQDYSYQYDLAGNIVSIDERVKHCGIRNPDPDRLLRAFDYDPIYRLTQATGRATANSSAAPPYANPQLSGFHPAGSPAFTQDNGPDLTEAYSEDYEYDPAGNMLAVGHSQGGARWVRQYASAAGSNRLASITVGSNAFACEYDANGNLSRQALNHYHDWDYADRMTGYRNLNGAATSVEAIYLYGADGMRVKKWVRRGGSTNGEETTTYIGGIFEHHRWSDNGANWENNRLHVMDNQSRVAMHRIGPAHHEEAAPEVQYHLGDHLGSSSLVMGGADARGAVFVNREEYFPYGETAFGSFGRKRYRFSGKERDNESGLDYFGARYYATWMARWVSCDPKGELAGLNIYSFVRGKPIRRIDPDGMQDVEARSGRTVDQVMEDAAATAFSEGDENKAAALNMARVGWMLFGSENLSVVADKGLDSSPAEFVSAGAETVINLFGGKLAAAGLKAAAPLARASVLSMALRTSAPEILAGSKAGASALAKEGGGAAAVATAKSFGSSLPDMYSGAKPLDDLFPQLKGVNPHYVDSGGAGVNVNCGSVADAVFARLRGLDPSAVARNTTYTSYRQIDSAFIGFEHGMTLKSATAAMLARGEGAVASVVVNESHAINATVKDGVLYWLDGQSGYIVDLSPSVKIDLSLPY